MQRTKKPETSLEEKRRSFVPTGSVLLNLACSDKAEGGYELGKYVNLIGDSSSGKTLLALSMFAECAKDVRFDDYLFVYDDVESGCGFDIRELFGSKVASRIKAPYYKEDEACPSDTIQDFHANILDLINEEKKFIYVLDSFDALTDKSELAKADAMAEATRKDKDISGSYGMDKPKLIGQILRQIKAKLNRSESFLLIISQTRDNIDPMSFEKRTRSGGRALKFYAWHEIWLALAGKLKSKEKVIGSNVKAKITKNRCTGKQREVEFPIYYQYGVDDVGACVDFLVEEGTWPKKGNTLIAEDLGLEGTRQKLIREIEEKNLEKQLFLAADKLWKSVEDSLKMNRKPKYE